MTKPEALSPHQMLEEDQQRYDRAVVQRDKARFGLTRLIHNIRAQYLGAVVQQDLAAVEAADIAAIPGPRLAVE